jgi:hypothetical protein
MIISGREKLELIIPALMAGEYQQRQNGRLKERLGAQTTQMGLLVAP